MNKKEIIQKTIEYIKNKSFNDTTGHDWWHTCRVWKMAKKLAKEEKANLFIVEMSALLHDAFDWKYYNKNLINRNLNNYLIKLNLDQNDKDHIKNIIVNMSFKGSRFKNNLNTIEGKIVYDADKLDAIGAIGIARMIITGVSFNRPLYNPDIPLSRRVKDLTKQRSYSNIHHFYDKLLLIKNLLYTKNAKKIAVRRHDFMKKFLDEFFAEWEGKQ